MVILSATDHSLRSQTALNYSFGLAKALKCELVVLNVFDVPPISPAVYDKYFKFAIKEEKEKSVNKSIRFIEELDMDFDRNDVDFRIDAAFGSSSEVILKYAKKIKADLIITGAKGKSALENFVFGSTTAKLLGASKIPVLAIPEESSFNGLMKIIFHSEYSASEITDLDGIVKLFSDFKPEIVCVIIDSDGSDVNHNKAGSIEKRIKEKVKYNKLRIKFITSSDVIETLNSIIQYEQADLMAMTTKQRNIFTRLFKPSKARKLCFRTTVPLLTMSK